MHPPSSPRAPCTPGAAPQAPSPEAPLDRSPLAPPRTLPRQVPRTPKRPPCRDPGGMGAPGHPPPHGDTPRPRGTPPRDPPRAIPVCSPTDIPYLYPPPRPRSGALADRIPGTPPGPRSHLGALGGSRLPGQEGAEATPHPRSERRLVERGGQTTPPRWGDRGSSGVAVFPEMTSGGGTRGAEGVGGTGGGARGETGGRKWQRRSGTGRGDRERPWGPAMQPLG